MDLVHSGSSPSCLSSWHFFPHSQGTVLWEELGWGRLSVWSEKKAEAEFCLCCGQGYISFYIFPHKLTLRTKVKNNSQHKRMELGCPWHKHQDTEVLVGQLGLGLSDRTEKITFWLDC